MVFLSTLASGTLTGAALTLLAIALTAWTRRRFSARWHRLAYSLLMCFYALPLGLVIRSARLLLGRRVPEEIVPADAFPPPLTGLQLEHTTVQTSIWQEMQSRLPAVLLLVWLTGALLLLSFRLLQLRRFRAMLEATNSPVRDARVLVVWKRTCSQIGMRRIPHLRKNACIDTPMLTGLGRDATLILPESSMSGQGLDYVFRHELTHARHRDLYLKWAGMLLCCIHWFNPMPYLLGRRLSHWMELACDEDVVRQMSSAQRREYGLTILDVLGGVHSDYNGICAALCENKMHMKERLQAMLNSKQKNTRTKLASALVLVLVCVCGTVVSSASQTQSVSLPVSEAKGQVTEPLPQAADALDLQGQEALTNGYSSGTQARGEQPQPADMPDAQEQEAQLDELSGSSMEPDNAKLIAAQAALDKLGEGPSQFLWPAPGTSVATTYQGHTGRGIDFAPGGAGHDIIAAADGMVVKVVRGYTGYGHYAIIDHGGGYQTLYAHCQSIDVEIGEMVKAGDVIAAMGRTGWATGNHLHFELRYNKRYMDARDYIDPNNQPVDFPE